MDWAAERQRMLQDIEREVVYTRNYIHYDHLSEDVMSAMETVPRHQFVPAEMQEYSYDNGPLSIGYGQTISQPYIVALMTQLLEVDAQSKVLEIGTGSAYQTAVLSQVVNKIYSVELVEELCDISRRRLQQLGYENIETRCADGYLGWPEHAPYDGIIVTAAADKIPQPLIDQLKPGARLVIPVKGGFMGQELLLVKKDLEGVVATESILPVAFVPLVHA